MCLRIETRKLVAKTDLLVYKCLDSHHTGEFCTPFQYIPVVFENGMAVIDGGKRALLVEWEHYSDRRAVRVVNYGVHAYTKKIAAEATASYFRDCGTKAYYAVIPKGCKYYLGTDSDIVSTKMIVFKSKRDYDNYAKEKDINKAYFGERSK